MPFDFTPTLSQRQFLAGRKTMQLDDAEGTVVAVESGCLWITMQNDSRDIVLTPGKRFEIDRSGRTLIAAEEDSRFELLAACACAEVAEGTDGVATRMARKLAALFGQWAQRRRFVPHY